MEHKHHGKSSANFLDANEILNELNLNGSETFMDAGCGDGYVAIKAIDEYLPNGIVYAVDLYDESINGLNEYKKENDVKNLINIEADITKEIPGVEDSSIDMVLMLNVFHGFRENECEVINILKKIIKDEGKIAIMDFKPIEMQKGPPVDIKYSPGELEEIFNSFGFRKIHLNEEIGEDIPEGKSHYIIIFEKE